MNCKITEQQTRQIMRLDGDVTESMPEETLGFKLLIMLPISSSVTALNHKLVFVFSGKYLLKVLVASLFWHSCSPMLRKKSLNAFSNCL